MVNLKNTTLSILLLTFLISCGKDPIYLENGTIKCKDTPIGMEFFVEEMKGNVTVVDREMLEKLIKDRGDLKRVCTSNITDMGGVWNADSTDFIIPPLFHESNINQDISSWDVSNVTNMTGLFRGSEFNQPIGNWDVSNVTDMNDMFVYSEFNQPIGNWDVSSVTNMTGLFWGSEFNQPIGNWDVSNVTDMTGLFWGSEFNQPIGNWDVSNVTKMSRMFASSPFTHPIPNWDVSSVTDMSSMFAGSPFNQLIGNWDVSNVTDMSSMFEQTPFNQPIGNWDVSNVTDMSSMFTGSPFNQPIGNWDVKSITSLANFPRQLKNSESYKSLFLRNILSSLSFKSINGEIARLSDYGEKIILLDFWESWCSPCINVFPEIDEIKKEYNEELEVFSINTILADDESDVMNFVKNNSYNFNWLLDTNGVSETLVSDGIPYKILIYPNGEITFYLGSRGSKGDYDFIKKNIESNLE